MSDNAKKQANKQNPTSLELVSKGIVLALEEKKIISKPQSYILSNRIHLKNIKTGKKTCNFKECIALWGYTLNHGKQCPKRKL